MANMVFADLPVSSIELDTSNPRIAQSLEMYGDNITSEDIALALSNGSGEGTTSYDGLFESIKFNKGIINPIIVNEVKEGKYIVVEGNTRVQIYRELGRADTSGLWDKIPALVYSGMTSEEIHEIRLQAHLVGPRNWNPFSKAKYLYELSEKNYLSIEAIVSLCGGKEKRSEISKSINAYKDMMQYYKPITDTGEYLFNTSDFSYFVELQNNSVINALVACGNNKTDFSQWVLDQKLVNAMNVRKLPKVLANKNARNVFIKDNMNEALQFVSVADQGSAALSQASILGLVAELTNRIKKMGYSDLRRLRGSASAEEERVNFLDLKDELDNLVDEFSQDSNE